MSAANALESKGELQHKLDQTFAHFTLATPGCVVGVSAMGVEPIVAAYGAANLEYGIPLQPNSILESGSVAKQYTAAAIALLHLEKKLSLDDDIRKYLPEIPNFGTKITIRHLLVHSSGLREQWGLMSLMGTPPTTAVHTNAQILHLLSKQQALDFAPGDEHAYRNTGYVLAAIIVERASGRSISRYMHDRFFIPMGITNTFWREDHRQVVPQRATAYDLQGANFVTAMPFTNVHGNGGLLTTIGDALKWNKALQTNTITGGAALVAILETHGKLNSGQLTSYAHGLIHGKQDGRRTIYHDGSTAGYQTISIRYPDDSSSIVVFCNSRSISPSELAAKIASIFFPTKQIKEATLPTNSQEQLSQLIGRYHDPISEDIAEFSMTNSALFLRGTFMRGRVVQVSENLFQLADGEPIQLAIEFNKKQVRIQNSDGIRRAYISLPTEQSPTQSLNTYAGIYESPELDIRYSVMYKNEKIFLKLAHHAEIALAPLNRDLFSSAIGTIRFVRDHKDAITGFRASSNRYRNVKFVRSSNSVKR